MKRSWLLLFTLVLGSAAQTSAPPAQPQPRPQPGPPAPQTLEEAQRLVTRLWNRQQDWAQLGRYRDDNAKLAAPAKGEQRVVFYGDSITDGWKLAEYFSGKPYVNRGISGQTTSQMVVRFRQDVIDLKPKVVVILAGVNDLAGWGTPATTTLAAIQANYATMAELARLHKVRLVFASVLPIHDYGARKMTERVAPENILALNRWLQDYCAAQKHLYLDYYSHMLDSKNMLRAELAADGLHPNAAGYKVMAPLAEQAVGRALRGR